MYNDVDQRCVSAIVSAYRPGASITHQRDKVRVQSLFRDSDVGVGVFGVRGAGKSALLNLILRFSEHEGDFFVEGSADDRASTTHFFGQCLGTNSNVCVFDTAGTTSLHPWFAYDAGRLFNGHQAQDSLVDYAETGLGRVLRGLQKNLDPTSGHQYVSRREDMVDTFVLVHRLPATELRLPVSEALQAELAAVADMRAAMKARCNGVEPVTAFTFADELQAALGADAERFREAVRAAAGDPGAFFVDCTASVEDHRAAAVARELIKAALRRADKALLTRSRSRWFRMFHRRAPPIEEVSADMAAVAAASVEHAGRGRGAAPMPAMPVVPVVSNGRGKGRR